MSIINEVSLYSIKEIDSSEKRVKTFLSNFLDKQKVIVTEKKPIAKSSLQGLLKTTMDDQLDQIILDLILENAYKAENISPGGFQKTLENFVFSNIKTSFNQESFHPKKSDIENFIKNQLSSKEADILLTALELAGLSGKITIEKSQNDKTNVELVNSYIFECHSYHEKSIKLIKPKIIVIDGFIESVSEINILLESLVSTGHQLVLVTRGYHPDVINTIKVNNDRKTISVYLIEVPFDLNGINSLVDICIASSCELISSNLGQLISNVSIKDSSEVDEVSISKNKILIKKNSSKHHVKIHLRELIHKMKNNHDISEIYEKRISCFKSDCVIIRIPNDSQFVEISHRLDYCLRMIPSMMSYGVLNDNSLTYTRYVSIFFANKARNCIRDLGCVVVC